MAFGIIATIVFLIYTIDSYTNYGKDEDTSFYKKCTILSAIIAIVATIIVAFTPSRETYLLMKGGAVVDKAITNNGELKEIPENTLNLLNEYIKTVTGELKTETDEHSEDN